MIREGFSGRVQIYYSYIEGSTYVYTGYSEYIERTESLPRLRGELVENNDACSLLVWHRLVLLR